jgi:hypothetical protein
MNDQDLTSILEELKSREPIFHHPEFGVTRSDLEKQTSQDFWEVGASGKKYSRQLIIDTVVERFETNTEPDTAGWEITDAHCQELGYNIYAFTYLLNQDGRLSRRLTLWQKTSEGWKIMYHQGTLVNK